MAKTKTTFFCQNCGNQSTKWVGKCTACNEWNTFVEEVVAPKSNSSKNSNILLAKEAKSKPTLINNISTDNLPRIILADKELNQVLGGGIVPGSLILIGGEPGIGKSTLMLQVALSNNLKVLYISGEESENQIKLRAERIGIKNEECLLLTETSTQSIIQHLIATEPNLVVIDSIQTLHSAEIESAAGSISQIRQTATELMQYAKTTNTPVFLVGHITKDGHIAGPKILEHMVDTVLQFEGDRNHIYRILRATKNRFGSTSEIGIYEMIGSGLQEVANPSDILISQRDEEVSGVAIAATMEGLRPLLIETQALVSTAAYGTPQRSTTGFDTRRLNMLLAVLEKRCRFKLATKDVFLNLAGGIKVDDPAVDLAVVCAVLSSNVDISIPQKTCFAAEVGLSGEIRSVNKIEQRISEAEKLGFEKIFISKYSTKNIKQKDYKIEIVAVKKIEEVFRALFA
jgi:DNA repair protein RadA/Sms